MFKPARCPNEFCSAHHDLTMGVFYQKRGSYKPKCRSRPVPRFHCKHCRRGFSRQTFKADYRDHRPDLNVRLFLLLASGVGLRQSGRLLSLSKRCTEIKFRKIARHLGSSNKNLSWDFHPGTIFQMDEMESFEGYRSARPLTIPVVISEQSMYIVAARSAPIRPSGAMPESRIAAIRRDEAMHGRRPQRSRAAVSSVLKRTAMLCPKGFTYELKTDKKTTYPDLVRRSFVNRSAVLHTYSSKLPRDSSNPLFKINLTNAIARDLMGRLRRRSWLVTKRRCYLNLHLNLLCAYRNFIRVRFNDESKTPAQLEGFVHRRLRPGELFNWRQDWGKSRSIHPLSRGDTTVARFHARMGAVA